MSPHLSECFEASFLRNECHFPEWTFCSDSNFEEKDLSKQRILDCNDATKDDKLVLYKLAHLEEFDQFASKYFSVTCSPVDVKEKREAL